MSGIPQNTNTLTIAKESLAMSEKTGDKTFQKMALGLMALTGIGTMLHVIHQLYRDMQPKGEKARATRHAQPAEVKATPEQHDREPEPQESWVQKARVGERPAEQERVWSESLTHQGKGRHH